MRPDGLFYCELDGRRAKRLVIKAMGAGAADPEGRAATACLIRAALVREERLAWASIAVGVALWATGEAIWRVFYSPLTEPPLPSIADAF